MRTLTIVVCFDEDRPPDWIWENHKRNSYQYGILVTAIAEGDYLRKDHDDED